MENVEVERAGAMALNRIFGDTPRISRAIVEGLGGAAAAFSLGTEDLRDIFGPGIRGIDRINKDTLEQSVEELARLESSGVKYICILEDAYPKALKECDDAPVGLYCRSSSPPESVFGRTPCISVVGTRDMSSYGKEWCERIVATLAGAPVKPVIVSGLAIGVDITAQMTALTTGIPTIGVIPTGIDEIYPRRHTVAAEKIIASEGGAIISDFPPGTETYQGNFLKRNRIIAGMSVATILIESRVKGGGMMTANLASGYGRDVFALPGRIDDPRSGGCNVLLGRKMAEPVVSLETLCDELGLGSGTGGRKETAEERIRRTFPEEPLCSICLHVAEAVREERGITPDMICRKTGIPFTEVSRACWMMEGEGILEMDLLQRCTIKSKIF